MFELFIYCSLGLCIVWDIGLVIYMMFESAQDVRELENICNSHKLSQSHKKAKPLSITTQRLPENAKKENKTKYF